MAILILFVAWTAMERARIRDVSPGHRNLPSFVPAGIREKIPGRLLPELRVVVVSRKACAILVHIIEGE